MIPEINRMMTFDSSYADGIRLRNVLRGNRFLQENPKAKRSLMAFVHKAETAKEELHVKFGMVPSELLGGCQGGILVTALAVDPKINGMHVLITNNGDVIQASELEYSQEAGYFYTTRMRGTAGGARFSRPDVPMRRSSSISGGVTTEVVFPYIMCVELHALFSGLRSLSIPFDKELPVKHNLRNVSREAEILLRIKDTVVLDDTDLQTFIVRARKFGFVEGHSLADEMLACSREAAELVSDCVALESRYADELEECRVDTTIDAVSKVRSFSLARGYLHDRGTELKCVDENILDSLSDVASLEGSHYQTSIQAATEAVSRLVALDATAFTNAALSNLVNSESHLGASGVLSQANKRAFGTLEAAIEKLQAVYPSTKLLQVEGDTLVLRFPSGKITLTEDQKAKVEGVIFEDNKDAAAIKRTKTRLKR